MSAKAALEFQKKAEEFEGTTFDSFENLDTECLGDRTGRHHVGQRMRMRYTYYLRDDDGGFSATTTLIIQHYMGGSSGTILQVNVQTSQHT